MRWPRLGAILGLVLLSVLPAAAEGQNAVVRSDPAQLEVNAGQIATLSVVLAGAQNVYGIDVSATFDPQVVEVVDADPAKDGIQATPGAFPQPDFVARNVADNEAGTLRYAITQVHPTGPVSGTGVIFSVQFRAKAPSGQSAFTISSVDLTDLDGIALGVQPESGMIRVVPAGQAAPTTAPPTAPPTATIVPTTTSANLSAAAAPTNTTAAPAAPSPAPPAPQAIVPPTDSPVGPSQLPTAVTTDSATPAPQAVAAAETPAAVALAIAPAAAPPDAPVNSGAVAQADADAQRVPPAQNAPSPLLLRQPRVEDANAERATPREPSKLLLIGGVAALAAAAVTAMLMVVSLRR